MMNNLFSMFDPSTNFFNLNWFSLMLPLIFLPNSMYQTKMRLSLILMKLYNFIITDLKNNLKFKYNKNILFFMISFSMIFMFNILSILPYIFTPTSHLSISLTFSLPFWISLFTMGWMSNLNHMMIHLVPTGTPTLLCPFMVMIESISNVIRPMTLTIRLTANMIAGHILISLLSNNLDNNFIVFLMTSLALNILICLEMAVSMIQSYVFIILMSLYMNENL